MRHTGVLTEGTNMKPIVAGLLASIAALGLLSACGGDDLTLPTATNSADGAVLPGGDDTLPLGITIPEGALPSDVSIPQEAIDLMIAQFEAAGMKVDRDCFVALLADDSLRDLVAAGGAATPEAIQKFFSCIATG